MTSLWFVTPAYGRYGLTDVCLAERRWVCDSLAPLGIEAHCVVVADDDNLNIARSYGFDTVEQNNDWLGRKFNDGIEYAGKNDADWVVPIGSDSWIHPDYFRPAPRGERARTSKAYCVVTQSKLAQLEVGHRGAGPYVFPSVALRASGFRPAEDKIRKSVDRATFRGMPGIELKMHNVHPYQYIGFRALQHITAYDVLWSMWGVQEYNDPWKVLNKYYPIELVDKVKRNAGEWLIP